MRVVVVGATGMVGSRVVAEAAGRAHRVVAVSRRPARVPDGVAGPVSAVALDAGSPSRLDHVLAGADAAILAVRAPAGQEDSIVPVTGAVLDAAGRAGARLLVVGGAGPLRSPHETGRLAIDDPTYVPPAWRDVAAASVTQLDVCRRHANRGWVYLSPPAILEPGERSGTYRRGTTTLLTDDDGTSRITAEDLAVAVVDELERPGVDRHFTVARTSGLAIGTGSIR